MKETNNLDPLRHSAAHLLAAAVMELWPSTKRVIGPAIEDGFYYDFDFRGAVEKGKGKTSGEAAHYVLSEEDLPKIEAKKQYPNNPYKEELIDEFSKGNKKVSFYKSGNYWDLCRGGHVENPEEELKNFKLLSLAGAYWRGSEKNPMLTRIYGTVWPTKKELDAYLERLEEAKKRDHRKIGKDLGLFVFSEQVG